MPEPEMNAREREAYDWALRKIEECRQEGKKGTTLRINRMDLTHLPPEIGQLSSLVWLQLYHNQLTTLPPQIGQLSALQMLDLSENQLTTLPPHIGQLSALQSLNLEGNRLTTLPPHIGQLSALQSLNLYDNKLTHLPAEMAQLSRLERLVLHENAALGLPPEVLGATQMDNPHCALAKPKEILDYYFQHHPPTNPPDHGLPETDRDPPFDVFISYSSRNKLLADAICHALKAVNVRCWIAPRDIVGGDDWADSIVRAIPKCRGMLLVFSSHANNSNDVKREVTQAASNNLWILPVRVEDVAWTGRLAYYLDDTHWLDALSPPFEAHLDRIRDQVRTLVARSKR